MTVTITIPPRDVRVARREARKRNQSFEEHEAWDNQADTWGIDPEDRNFVGVMGEVAFAIYADVPIDTDTYEWSDGRGDFRVRIHGKELGVDIKTRRSEPHALWIKDYAVRADYYVLGHLHEPDEPESLDGWQVEFLGTATKDQVLDARKIASDHGHENYSILVEHLDPLPDPDAITERS